MTAPHALFEVSYEVCHPLGGVHTVVSTRAHSRVQRFGSSFVCVGPWLLASTPQAFEDDPTEAAFAEACRAAGLPVRVGFWTVPGRPRTLLVEFSGLIPGKDRLLGTLWDRHRVDSLRGGWDYVEPVLFGHAAGLVVERWWRERLADRHEAGVLHVHEWTAAGALLHVKDAVPALGTLFQAHATVLGSALGARGRDPLDALGTRTPEEVADEVGVRAAHSLEGAAARAADVFTTVSETAAEEATLFHGRRPDPLLPNVLDPSTFAAPVAALERGEVRRRVRERASRLVGEELGSAFVVFSSGRYDLSVKGFDVLLDALGVMNATPGRRIVVLLLVPAPNAGLKHEVRQRLAARPAVPGAPGGPGGPLEGFSTHALFEPEADAILRRATLRGLKPGPGQRVTLLHLPQYVEDHDEVFDLPYAGLVRAADLTCFPSFYESWGFTPQESLALGVPTVTTDVAGFGRYALSQRLGPADGVTVLARRGRSVEAAVADLVAVLEGAARAPVGGADLERRCRAASSGVAEAELLRARGLAFRRALEAAQARSKGSAHPRPHLVALPPADPSAGEAPRLLSLDVPSRLPRALAGLQRLAWNWRWAWHAPTQALFHALAPERVEALRGNVLRLLSEADPGRLEQLCADPVYVAAVERAAREHDGWLAGPPGGAAGGVPQQRPVAYLSAEFALHACLPIYSGGLGVLAGDHLRAASDLGLPLVAVGLFYRRGYVRQRLEGGVEQISEDDPIDPRQVPLTLVLGEGGRPLEVTLPLPGATLTLRAWRADVGRVPLYLLDADHEGNRVEDRAITHRLYGGDAELRLKQELVLGRGGVRLLDRLGLAPSVLHVNEGHGAFAAVERIALLVREAGLTFDEAQKLVRHTTVFTTHTPVPAGHDRFDEDLLRRYLSDAPTWLGVSWERFVSLGSSAAQPREFNMTYLAARLSTFVNGVSRRHGEVSRDLLRPLAPALLAAEVPVRAITNGVHLESWTAPEVAALLGADREGVRGSDFARASHVPLEALAAVRATLRARLCAALQARLTRRMTEWSDPSWLVQQTLAGIDPEALWIVFARRFAGYKRAELLFRDPDRLRALLERPGTPVRVVLAGKAHPKDREGAERIGRLARLARSRVYAGKVFLLEGYDLDLARTLVQGADVWLNTPRPPHEASGTSGMKAAANGGLNLSILDGWWIEGHDGRNGWSVGAPDESASATEVQDDAARDRADAEALYRLLEDDVLPLWERREASGLRGAWLERVRHSLSSVPPVFDAQRMVAEYRDRAYAPLAAARLELEADGHRRLKALAAERRRVRQGFSTLRVQRVSVGDPTRVTVGSPLEVDAVVDLGPLSPDDVLVELVVGRRVEGRPSDLADPVCVALTADAARGPDGWRFLGRHALTSPGAYGYGVRVRPRADNGPGSRLHDPGVWG